MGKAENNRWGLVYDGAITENKEGARHIPTYFVPEFVEQEEKKLLEFFGEYLK